jgi:hypothetical protein
MAGCLEDCGLTFPMRKSRGETSPDPEASTMEAGSREGNVKATALTFYGPDQCGTVGAYKDMSCPVGSPSGHTYENVTCDTSSSCFS